MISRDNAMSASWTWTGMGYVMHAMNIGHDACHEHWSWTHVSFFSADSTCKAMCLCAGVPVYQASAMFEEVKCLDVLVNVLCRVAAVCCRC